MAAKGNMSDRGWNAYNVGGGHSPVNNTAHLPGVSVAPLGSAGQTSKSPGGKKDGAPPSRRGGHQLQPSGAGQRVGMATGKSAPYAKPKGGI